MEVVSTFKKSPFSEGRCENPICVDRPKHISCARESYACQSIRNPWRRIWNFLGSCQIKIAITENWKLPIGSYWPYRGLLVALCSKDFSHTLFQRVWARNLLTHVTLICHTNLSHSFVTLICHTRIPCSLIPLSSFWIIVWITFSQENHVSGKKESTLLGGTKFIIKTQNPL